MPQTILRKDKLFGTDGIRGTPGVYPLTSEMLYKIGSGIAKFASSRPAGLKSRSKKPKVIIGKDTRMSGNQIEGILTDSIKDEGIDVLIAGIITTPGLSFLTKHLKADIGIMISASHNKATENGIKFFNSCGHKLSCQEEEQIENIFFDDSTHYSNTHYRCKVGKISKIKDTHSIYVKFLTSTMEGLNLNGMSIALDCAFGAASPFARNLFENLGAEVFSINDIPHGDNINVGGAINPHFLKELVLESGADIGVAVDGDGDRGILVDEKGRVLDGDFTMAVMAGYLLKKNKLPRNTIVTTVMSNYGLKVFLDNIGVKMVSTDVGDKYVLDALIKNNLILGGEQSGHIIFLDYLSTPDGLLTALQLLRVMKDTDSPLSELAKCITKYPQVLVNVEVKAKKPFDQMSSLCEKLRFFNSQLAGSGRILLRYSGTESLARVMVEGKDKNIIQDISDSLANELRRENGLETKNVPTNQRIE